jgi:signal transduction histidine kinase
VDVNQLVREVLALLESQAQSHDVAIATSFTEDVPLVLADRVQLQQVVLNLVMNAIEATAAVTDRERTVRIGTQARFPEGVILIVEDTGPGIEPERMDRIFEAFYTTKAHGMGMGLSICRSIVEAHGGHLTVARGLPHGSVFRASLPTSSEN